MQPRPPPHPAHKAAVSLRPQVPSPILVPPQGMPSPKCHRGSQPQHPSAPGKGRARPPECKGPDPWPLPFSKHRRSHLPPATRMGCGLGRGHPDLTRGQGSALKARELWIPGLAVHFPRSWSWAPPGCPARSRLDTRLTNSAERSLRHAGQTHEPYLEIHLFFLLSLIKKRASLVAQTVNNLPACRRARFNPWVEKIPWRREWLLTPVFSPGEFHGQWSLVGYSPWGWKESDTTKRLTLSLYIKNQIKNDKASCL